MVKPGFDSIVLPEKGVVPNDVTEPFILRKFTVGPTSINPLAILGSEV
jgi:hypothetical protein